MLHASESAVCRPYSCLQLVKLLNDYNALPESLYPLLVDWKVDSLACENDLANLSKWTTHMKATQLDNNAICEGLAQNLIHVPGEDDGTWS